MTRSKVLEEAPAEIARRPRLYAPTLWSRIKKMFDRSGRSAIDRWKRDAQRGVQKGDFTGL